MYILGTSRSGSTILDNILGEIGGFVSVGELRSLWRRTLEDRLCGCGSPLVSCPFWTQVRGAAEANVYPRDVTADTVLKWQRETMRFHHLAGVLRAKRHGIPEGSALDSYQALMRAMYYSIAQVSQCSVIVDSSKTSSGAALLQLIPDVDHYYIHIVRDARGVSYSEMSRKVNPDWQKQAYMPQAGTAFTIGFWLATNIANEITTHADSSTARMFLRYEDFIDNPRKAIESIVQMVDVPLRSLPFATDGTVKLSGNHTVAGNPSRFVKGNVSLEPDSRWIDSLPPMRRVATTIACSPLLVRYGYRLRRPRRDP